MTAATTIPLRPVAERVNLIADWLESRRDKASFQIRDLREAANHIAELEEALTEACKHQGLPLDSTPESIAKHFRLNRELRERLEAHVAGREGGEAT